MSASTDFSIQRAAKAHRDVIHRLLHDYSLDAFDKYDINHYLNEFDQAFSDSEKKHYVALVMVDDGRVVGFILAQKLEDSPYYWEIDCLCVHSELHGRGRGAQLLHAAEEQIHQFGGKYIILKTNHVRQNKKVEDFYQKHGYQRLAVFPNYYPHSNLQKHSYTDSAIFEKHLAI